MDAVESYGATAATYVSGDTANAGVLDVGETLVYSASYTLTGTAADDVSVSRVSWSNNRGGSGTADRVVQARKVYFSLGLDF